MSRQDAGTAPAVAVGGAVLIHGTRGDEAVKLNHKMISTVMEEVKDTVAPFDDPSGAGSGQTSFRPIQPASAVLGSSSDATVAPTPDHGWGVLTTSREVGASSVDIGTNDLGNGGENGTTSLSMSVSDRDSTKRNGTPADTVDQKTPGSPCSMEYMGCVASRGKGKGKARAVSPSVGDIHVRRIEGTTAKSGTTPPPRDRPITRGRSDGVGSGRVNGEVPNGKRGTDSLGYPEGGGDKEGMGEIDENGMDVDGTGAEVMEEGPKMKRRRRTLRPPTPPQSFPPLAQSQNQQTAESLGRGPGMKKRLRRRGDTPVEDSLATSNGQTGGTAKTGSGILLTGPGVKKRGRQPSTKSGGESDGTEGAGAVIGSAEGGGGRGMGRRGPGRPSSRGRGRGRGRGWARGRRRSLADSAAPRGPSNKGRDTTGRWRMHRMAEDYINVCGNITYPRVSVGTYGFSPEEGRYPIDRPSTLGTLRSSLRRPSVIEMWSPHQVACFESAIHIYGKKFHRVAEAVEGKSCTDVVEFYYVWKKTDHYKQWKAKYTHEMAVIHPHVLLEEDAGGPVELMDQENQHKDNGS
ncbi:unnamed protein product, partial [Discosporangium mesarthrocarpum]